MVRNKGDVPKPHQPKRAQPEAEEEIEEVTFDSSSLSFVNDWVTKRDGEEESKPVEEGGEEQTGKSSRAGLGATKPVPKGVGALKGADALEEKVSRKRRRGQDALKNAPAAEDVGEHGVVGNGLDVDEEGRTAAIKPVKSVKGAQKNGGEAGVIEGVKKKRKKKKKTTANNEANQAEADASISVGNAADESKTRKQSSTQPPQQESEGGGSTLQSAQKQPRKKGKTRSKQKNIRKDTRSADKKPVHLRLGDPNFSGRLLTKETKERLGLPEDCDEKRCAWEVTASPAKAPQPAAAEDVKRKPTKSKYKNFQVKY